MIDKKELRRILDSRLSGLSESYITSAGGSISDMLLASEEYRKALSIFVFVSTEREPSTRGIILKALSDGKEVYVPKCVDETTMLAVRIRDMNDLVPGSFGILEPAVVTETKTAGELDLIIVPCLAASLGGKRLGHGRGYYDRFLSDHADNAILLCFSAMLLDDIPTEEHDILIPKVITD